MVDALNDIAKDLSYKETAEAMDIPNASVRPPIEHVYHKLHIQSRAR